MLKERARRKDQTEEEGMTKLSRSGFVQPRFWGILALQLIDVMRAHFQKIDFSHSLALQPTPYSVRYASASRRG